jgi:hypothetical protein
MRGEDFQRERAAAFDEIIARIGMRLAGAAPVIILEVSDKSPETLRANAEKDSWTLFLGGVRHLKDGAPEGQPGALAEAVARASLRASPLAAALSVPAPQFEPVLLNINYAGGREAALFPCQRLVEAAEADFPKSRQIIQGAILAEKPEEKILKEQMALAFGVLAEVYMAACRDLRRELEGL